MKTALEADTVFPSSYLDSRARFHALATNLGQTVETFLHWVDRPEPLATDVIYLGKPDAPLLFVIVSGTHGVEAYAGAACQFALLRTYALQFASLRDIGFLLVHAANPWGFRYDRRVTHEGVDLNRNFVDFTQFAKLAASDQGYARYHSWLLANQTSSSVWLLDNVRVFAGLLNRRRRLDFQHAVTRGQYSYPDGLFYGGTAPTECRRILEQIFSRYLPGRHLRVMLDLHTGLGKRGDGVALSELDIESPSFQKLSAWLDGSLSSVARGQAVSSLASGTLVQAFDNFNGAPSLSLVLEFGTANPWKALQALRREQQVHRNPLRFTQRESDEIRKQMRAAFFIDDADWKSKVLHYFDHVLTALVRGALSTQTHDSLPN
jgi:hypothetical protein